MFNARRLLPAFVTALLLLCLVPGAAAQTDGTLTPGQPSIGEINTPGTTLTYDYTLASVSSVTMQAIGDTVQPSIRVLRDGAVISEQLNPAGESIVTLTTVLSAGAYQVEVGGVSDTQGLVVLIVQTETPIAALPLAAGVPVSGEINVDAPVALFSVDPLTSPAFLYVESETQDSSARVRLINTTTGQTSASLDADVLGARLRLPAGSAAYQIEISHSGGESGALFFLCLSDVNVNACEPSSGGEVAPLPELSPTTSISINCTVASSFAGGTNIRQSANLNAVVVGVLPADAAAQVLGISPDGAFYNILHNGVVGWTAISALASSGDCTAVPVVNPPTVTLVPVQPTLTPTQPPPPQPTAIPPSATPSGPCLITMTAPALVYSQTSAQADYIQDQVQAGFELIPIGRLADNSWWRTNYMNAWIQTSLFGSAATVSGDCSSLPVLIP